MKTFDALYPLIKTRVEQSIAAHDFPGCVIGLIDKDGSRALYPFGAFTYAPDALLVENGTMYDVASITKSIPGSTLLLWLIEKGELHLDDPLIKFVPKFNNLPGKDKVTIHHVLTNTLDLDLPPLSSLRDKSPEEIISTVVLAPLKSPPGERYQYVNSTALFMHMIIETVSRNTIDTLAKKVFFDPLGMRESTFTPQWFPLDGIPPTEIVDWRGGEVRGVVHDESSFVLSRGYRVAIAGLFTTTSDLLSFAEMLLAEGTTRGQQFFSKETVQGMHTNQFPDKDFVAGLGWELDQEWMGKERKGIFGKRGFTGCSFMVHPEGGRALVILSNATYPHRPDDLESRHLVRKDIADIVFVE